MPCCSRPPARRGSAVRRFRSARCTVPDAGGPRPGTPARGADLERAARHRGRQGAQARAPLPLPSQDISRSNQDARQVLQAGQRAPDGAAEREPRWQGRDAAVDLPAGAALGKAARRGGKVQELHGLGLHQRRHQRADGGTGPARDRGRERRGRHRAVHPEGPPRTLCAPRYAGARGDPRAKTGRVLRPPGAKDQDPDEQRDPQLRRHVRRHPELDEQPPHGRAEHPGARQVRRARADRPRTRSAFKGLQR